MHLLPRPRHRPSGSEPSMFSRERLGIDSAPPTQISCQSSNRVFQTESLILTGPTTHYPRSRQDSCLSWAVELVKRRILRLVLVCNWGLILTIAIWTVRGLNSMVKLPTAQRLITRAPGDGKVGSCREIGEMTGPQKPALWEGLRRSWVGGGGASMLHRRGKRV